MARGQQSEPTSGDNAAGVSGAKGVKDAKAASAAKRGKGVEAVKGAKGAKGAQAADGKTPRASVGVKGAKSAKAARTEAAGRTRSRAGAAVQDLPAELIERPRFDFERLERAVSVLAEQHSLLCKEKGSLAEQLEASERRVRELEAELDESRSRRQRAIQRLDTLISDLDRLDGELLASAGDGSAAGTSARRGTRARASQPARRG